MSADNKDIDPSLEENQNFNADLKEIKVNEEIKNLKAELEELKLRAEISNLKNEISSLKKNKSNNELNQIDALQKNAIHMSTPFLRDEKIIQEAFANHWRGIEAVGGRLILTSQRLIFESHAFNIQTGNTVIPLLGINHMEKGFLNIINVYSENNIKNAFTVWGRTKWIKAINKVKKGDFDD